MLSQVNFKNRRAGRQPQAAFWLRALRMLRRKRVAYARTGAAHALKVAQQELDRVYKLARAHNVPINDTGPLPVLPTLPGRDWVEYRQAMGELTPAIGQKSPRWMKLNTSEAEGYVTIRPDMIETRANG